MSRHRKAQPKRFKMQPSKAQDNLDIDAAVTATIHVLSSGKPAGSQSEGERAAACCWPLVIVHSYTSPQSCPATENSPQQSEIEVDSFFSQQKKRRGLDPAPRTMEQAILMGRLDCLRSMNPEFMEPEECQSEFEDADLFEETAESYPKVDCFCTTCWRDLQEDYRRAPAARLATGMRDSRFADFDEPPTKRARF